MYDLILPLLCIIQLGVPPYTTPEINILIEQMGDVKFIAREKAYKKLEKIGYPALRGLEIARNYHPDVEVRARSERLIKKYLFLDDVIYPYIYALPEESSSGIKSVILKNKKIMVFPNGTAKKYFFKAQGNEMQDWNSDFFVQASYDLAIDLLWQGWSKEEVIEAMYIINENTPHVFYGDMFR